MTMCRPFSKTGRSKERARMGRKHTGLLCTRNRERDSDDLLTVFFLRKACFCTSLALLYVTILSAMAKHKMPMNAINPQPVQHLSSLSAFNCQKYCASSCMPTNSPVALSYMVAFHRVKQFTLVSMYVPREKMNAMVITTAMVKTQHAQQLSPSQPSSSHATEILIFPPPIFGRLDRNEPNTEVDYYSLIAWEPPISILLCPSSFFTIFSPKKSGKPGLDRAKIIRMHTAHSCGAHSCYARQQ
eukprot:484046-Rhodomonas_salina.1